MGDILNPVSSNSFVDLVTFKDEDVFVDKTDFIAKMSENINKNKRLFAALTRMMGCNSQIAKRIK